MNGTTQHDICFNLLLRDYVFVSFIGTNYIFLGTPFLLLQIGCVFVVVKHSQIKRQTNQITV